MSIKINYDSNGLTSIEKYRNPKIHTDINNELMNEKNQKFKEGKGNFTVEKSDRNLVE